MFTSGFFNSINSDRRYNAEQMASIFDGLITDGIFDSIGDHFQVTPASSGLGVNIGTGRAWLNQTWSYNDTAYPVALDAASPSLSRKDLICLKVDKSSAVRSNSLVVIAGTPAASPVEPTVTDDTTNGIYYHKLAAVTVQAGATSISAADIMNYIGLSTGTPYVTGIIESTAVDELWSQWDGEFNDWWDDIKATLDDNIVTTILNKIDHITPKEATMNLYGFSHIDPPPEGKTYQAYSTDAILQQISSLLNDVTFSKTRLWNYNKSVLVNNNADVWTYGTHFRFFIYDDSIYYIYNSASKPYALKITKDGHVENIVSSTTGLNVYDAGYINGNTPNMNDCLSVRPVTQCYVNTASSGASYSLVLVDPLENRILVKNSPVLNQNGSFIVTDDYYVCIARPSSYNYYCYWVPKNSSSNNWSSFNVTSGSSYGAGSASYFATIGNKIYGLYVDNSNKYMNVIDMDSKTYKRVPITTSYSNFCILYVGERYLYILASTSSTGPWYLGMIDTSTDTLTFSGQEFGTSTSSKTGSTTYGAEFVSDRHYFGDTSDGYGIFAARNANDTLTIYRLKIGTLNFEAYRTLPAYTTPSYFEDPAEDDGAAIINQALRRINTYCVRHFTMSEDYVVKTCGLVIDLQNNILRYVSSPKGLRNFGITIGSDIGGVFSLRCIEAYDSAISICDNSDPTDFDVTVGRIQNGTTILWPLTVNVGPTKCALYDADVSDS